MMKNKQAVMSKSKKFTVFDILRDKKCVAVAHPQTFYHVNADGVVFLNFDIKTFSV